MYERADTDLVHSVAFRVTEAHAMAEDPKACPEQEGTSIPSLPKRLCSRRWASRRQDAHEAPIDQNARRKRS